MFGGASVLDVLDEPLKNDFFVIRAKSRSNRYFAELYNLGNEIEHVSRGKMCFSFSCSRALVLSCSRVPLYSYLSPECFAAPFPLAPLTACLQLCQESPRHDVLHVFRLINIRENSFNWVIKRLQRRINGRLDILTFRKISLFPIASSLPLAAFSFIRSLSLVAGCVSSVRASPIKPAHEIEPSRRIIIAYTSLMQISPVPCIVRRNSPFVPREPLEFMIHGGNRPT
jgi:hypothetical protein